MIVLIINGNNAKTSYFEKKSPTPHYSKRASITNEENCQSTLRKLGKHGITATGMYTLTVSKVFWPLEIQIVYGIDRDPPGNSSGGWILDQLNSRYITPHTNEHNSWEDLH